MKGQWFTRNRISWHEKGDGEPVVFLHAMAGSATAWEPQIEELGCDYRCIAWDMPGFGQSAPLASDARMGEVVDLLAAFIASALGLSRVHLVGLSVGGMILQKFGIKYPAMARSLTIIDSSPKFGFGGTIRPEEFVDPILATLASTSVDSFSQNMIRAIVGPNCSEAVIEKCIGAMARARVDGLTLTTHLIAQHDALENLARISAPTLVLVGELDRETPPDYSKFIADQIPRARFEIVTDAGHLSNMENPHSVNKQIRAFLSALR